MVRLSSRNLEKPGDEVAACPGRGRKRKWWGVLSLLGFGLGQKRGVDRVLDRVKRQGGDSKGVKDALADITPRQWSWLACSYSALVLAAVFWWMTNSPKNKDRRQFWPDVKPKEAAQLPGEESPPDGRRVVIWSGGGGETRPKLQKSYPAFSKSTGIQQAGFTFSPVASTTTGTGANTASSGSASSNGEGGNGSGNGGTNGGGGPAGLPPSGYPPGTLIKQRFGSNLFIIGEAGKPISKPPEEVDGAPPGDVQGDGPPSLF